MFINIIYCKWYYYLIFFNPPGAASGSPKNARSKGAGLYSREYYEYGAGGGGVSEGVKSLSLNIEVPQNETEFNLGLMFRESLDYDSGMLFIFDEVGQKSFHMKDTKISLDIYIYYYILWVLTEPYL